MKFNYLSLIKPVSVIALCGLFFASCGNGKETTENGEDLQESDKDTVKTTVVNVGGKLFSIPSPVQTSMLIQKTGAAFNAEIISSHKADDYKGVFYQGINLGVFGADLGYATMYAQSDKQVKYLAQAQKLSDALGISNAFDVQTMKRIQSNMDKKDSLLVLVGVAYRSSDAFLKANQRNVVSALILVGGWVESLNFAAQVNKTNPNNELKMRLAHQKQTLATIVDLLKTYKDEGIPELSQKLSELQKIYDGVKLTYVYEKPETDALNKITTINSRTDVTISDEQVKQITEKVKEIRDWCIAGEKI